MFVAMLVGWVKILWGLMSDMRKITIIGSNLFELAAVQLGDALQWINIARSNYLVDPMLTGQNQLLIPRFSSTFADGIGPQ
jgi:hypothetical protein